MSARLDADERDRIRSYFERMGCAQLRDAAPRHSRLPGPSLRRRAGGHLAGPAFPVATPNDMLPVLQALDAAPAGSVLVVVNEGEESDALAGDILLTAAREQRLAGLVVDGAVRDVDGLAAVGLPVFSREVHFVSAKAARVRTDRVPCAVRLGEADLAPGDWLFGDADGTLVIDESELRPCFNAALLLLRQEEELKAMLGAGERFAELCGLDDYLAGRGPLRFEP